MNEEQVKRLLDLVAAGDMDVADAASQLKAGPLRDDATDFAMSAVLPIVLDHFTRRESRLSAIHTFHPSQGAVKNLEQEFRFGIGCPAHVRSSDRFEGLLFDRPDCERL